MLFPQYRKYKNGMSYFEISSNEDFKEYKLNGKRLEVYEFKAKILPDRNYINDMLHNYIDHWDKISQEEFESFIEQHPNQVI